MKVTLSFFARLSLRRSVHVSCLCVTIVILHSENDVFAQVSRKLPPPMEADVELRIVAPQNDEIVNSDILDIFTEAKNVEVTPDGYQIVVILGEKMRQVINHPLRPATFRDLDPGTYLLRAFITDRHGKIVRSPKAIITSVVHFKKKDPSSLNVNQLNQPMLIVASPYGVFSHEQGRLILFDFVILNFRLGDRGTRLRYTIGDQSGYLLQSSPTLLTNLQTGEHTLTVKVVDQNDRPLPYPYLHAECKFTILPPSSVNAETTDVSVHLVSDEITEIPQQQSTNQPEEAEHQDSPRVIFPAPGMSVLADDPSWED